MINCAVFIAVTIPDPDPPPCRCLQTTQGKRPSPSLRPGAASFEPEVGLGRGPFPEPLVALLPQRASRSGRSGAPSATARLHRGLPSPFACAPRCRRGEDAPASTTEASRSKRCCPGPGPERQPNFPLTGLPLTSGSACQPPGPHRGDARESGGRGAGAQRLVNERVMVLTSSCVLLERCQEIFWFPEFCTSVDAPQSSRLLGARGHISPRASSELIPFLPCRIRRMGNAILKGTFKYILASCKTRLFEPHADDERSRRKRQGHGALWGDAGLASGLLLRPGRPTRAPRRPGTNLRFKSAPHRVSGVPSVH